MGWANCGEDSEGRPIGYAHEGTCDHPGCTTKIHRGLEYACGGMHGETGNDCEKYFCYKHLVMVLDPDKLLSMPQLCEECASAWPPVDPDSIPELPLYES